MAQLKLARVNSLNMTATEILLTLAGENEQPMNVLGKSIGVTAAAMTGIADRLSQRGLASRVFRGADRRTIYLSITAEGRAMAQQLTRRTR